MLDLKANVATQLPSYEIILVEQISCIESSPVIAQAGCEVQENTTPSALAIKDFPLQSSIKEALSIRIYDANELIIHTNEQFLGTLEFLFMLKASCFLLYQNTTEVFIALRNCAINKDLLNLKAQLELKFSDKNIYFCCVDDFEFFYARALKISNFYMLSASLCAKLKSLDSQHNYDKSSEDKEIVELLDFILFDALEQKASDVHLEQYEQKCFIKYRIDGILHTRFELEKEVFYALDVRLKLECQIDIGEKRRALDGRFSRDFSAISSFKSYDFRLSTMPSLHGLSIVIRILEKQNLCLKLDNLGFSASNLVLIKEHIIKSNGIILLVGPTGCGKSTTLHSFINYINDNHKKIITIEDPIEYQIDNVTQVLLNEKYFTFEMALRGILRQDPDVIMIGEIRDAQTLNMAVQASLTGHLVFATIHANSTLSALDRVKNLGSQDSLLALKQSLSLILSQRLARALCPHCKYEVRLGFYEDEIYQKFIEELKNKILRIDSNYAESASSEDLRLSAALYRSHGCSYCLDSGYKGRIMLSEVLKPSHRIFDGEVRGVFGMGQSMEEGIIHALNQGLTSLEEAYRVYS